MALKGFWGFDSCNIVKYPEWDNVLTLATTGRDGVANHATQMNGNSGPAQLNVPGGAIAGLILGDAWNLTVVNTLVKMAEFRSGVGTAAYLALNASSQVTLFTPAGVAIVTSAFVPTPSVWQFYEVRYVPSSSGSGSCIVRVNEVEIINFTGATTTTGITTIDNIRVEARSNNSVDDMYLLDLTDGTAVDGRPNNTFLGDVKVAHGYPTADGATVTLTPSTGTNHAALVDEVPPNTTDYVSGVGGGGSSAKDLYAITDLPTEAVTVYGVRVGLYAAKTDAGASGIKALIRESAGTEAAGPTQPLSTTYAGYFSDFIKLKPTGGVFTVPDVNGLQAGAQVA